MAKRYIHLLIIHSDIRQLVHTPKKVVWVIIAIRRTCHAEQILHVFLCHFESEINIGNFPIIDIIGQDIINPLGTFDFIIELITRRIRTKMSIYL